MFSAGNESSEPKYSQSGHTKSMVIKFHFAHLLKTLGAIGLEFFPVRYEANPHEGLNSMATKRLHNALFGCPH